MSLGSRIRKARKSRGLTQIELSEKSGIAVNSLRRYEADARQPQLSTLRRIAEALEVPVTQLMGCYEDFSVDLLARVLKTPGTKALEEKIANSAVNALGKLHMQDKEHEDQLDRVITAFSQLNNDGQKVAVERVEELTEIPKYKKE